MHPYRGIPPFSENDSGHLLGGALGYGVLQSSSNCVEKGGTHVLIQNLQHTLYVLYYYFKQKPWNEKSEKRFIFFKCWKKNFPLLRRSHVYENTQSSDSLHFIHQQCSSISMEPYFWQFVFFTSNWFWWRGMTRNIWLSSISLKLWWIFTI